jgi:type II secretory pathway pseudopilin PulG
MTLILQHPDTKTVRTVAIGYSWTVFFFGLIPLLIRGMFLHTLLLLILSIPTVGLAQIVYAFFINKLTAKHYLKKGYLAVEGPEWEYAKLTWSLREFEGKTVPWNDDISLGLVHRNKVVTRWVILSILSPIIFGILAAIAIPKLVGTHNENSSLEATSTVKNDEMSASETYLLARKYEKGDGVEKNYDKAIELYEQIATQGDVDAMFALGTIYSVDDTGRRDNAKAEKWYMQGANKGDPACQWAIGNMYESGQYGIEQSNSEAVKWYKKASEQGDETAKDSLDAICAEDPSVCK